MDVSTLFEYVQIAPLLICLCFGWVLKNTKPFESFSNDFIPFTNFVLGIVLVGGGTLISGDPFTVETLAGGAVTGVVSVGLHQLFSRTISGLSADNTTQSK